MSEISYADKRMVQIITSLVTAHMGKSDATADKDIEFFDRQMHAIIDDAQDDFAPVYLYGSVLGFLTALIENYSDEVGQPVHETLTPIVTALDRHPDRLTAVPIARALLMLLDPAEVFTVPPLDPTDCMTSYTDHIVMTLTIIDGLMAELAAALDVSPMDMVRVFFGRGDEVL